MDKHSEILFGIDFPILDIGIRVGTTYYIDFIEEHELQDKQVMRGIDYYDRRFIVFKCNLIYPDGSKTEHFTTVFQRYTQDNLRYHTAGCGQLLFFTDNDMNIYQMNMLIHLLTYGEYSLTKEQLPQLRINYYGNSTPPCEIVCDEILIKRYNILKPIIQQK
jgi:hypothetical protein